MMDLPSGLALAIWEKPQPPAQRGEGRHVIETCVNKCVGET